MKSSSLITVIVSTGLAIFLCACDSKKKTNSEKIISPANEIINESLQACSGSFSLSGIKVQSTQVEKDVCFEALFIPIAKGLFDQTLDFVVQALNGAIG